MEEECWNGDHYRYTLAVALPALIIWGIGLPIIAFVTLYHRNAIGTLY